MRNVLRAAVAAFAAVAAAPAIAGQCPPDKVMTDATKPNAAPAKGVTDNVLAAIDLAGEPAIIYVVTGEVTEYASNCAVPIAHKSGEVARETHVTAHWWKNTGKETAVLLSADLLHDASDHNM